ncbi:ribonuclease P protein component 1 [Candidatus Woesearchaeota archaeon]|nr:ribonuclease P protein component 1 [Candidatus Woesearchaeota archaeon]
MRSSQNILQHELIGLHVVVIDARNKDLIGIEGNIVDETKNCLVVETNKGERKILKADANFKINIDEKNIIIEGKYLVGRPEDRIKK